MVTVTFCIRLKTEILSIYFDGIIKSLDFKPYKMDIYYNEFSTPKSFIKYNSNLLNILSLSELDGGVTSFSLYDNRYSNEKVTPFFRAKILDTTFSNKQVVCLFEWVSYPKLYFNLDVSFLCNNLSDDAKIIFLIAYNQLDGIAEIETQNYFKKIFNSQAKWDEQYVEIKLKKSGLISDGGDNLFGKYVLPIRIASVSMHKIDPDADLLLYVVTFENND